jgi:hypothetical protein
MESELQDAKSDLLPENIRGLDLKIRAFLKPDLILTFSSTGEGTGIGNYCLK